MEVSKSERTNLVRSIPFFEQNLTEISIFPHYPNIPIEVEPVIQNGSGRYVSGQCLNHSFYSLALDQTDAIEGLNLGAIYGCSALTDDGSSTRTHWLYCVSVSPSPVFSISRNWSQPNCFAPLWSNIDTPLIKLEELNNLVAILASPTPSLGLAQAQIGRRGWLVMTSITTPHTMGLLIEQPTMPPMFFEGSENIMISAKCVRTLQSIGFDALTCVSVGDSALFLQRDVS